MKFRAIASGIVVAVLASCSGTEETSAKADWEGGAKFEKGTVVSLAELTEAMKDKTVQIEGTVQKLCPGKGCWVEVSDGKSSAIAKSLNDSVLFPKDAVGKKVLVQGIVRFKPAAACGEGSEGGHSGEGHECPKPDILVEIQGAKLFP
jgi:hypothetical protein